MVPRTKAPGNAVKKNAVARKAVTPKVAAPVRSTAVVRSRAVVPSRTSGQRRDFGAADGPDWQPSRRASFLVGVLGNKQIADLLQVAESQPSRWKTAKEVPGPRVAPLLVDLDHVVGRLLLVWDRETVASWLTGHNAFLDGSRPIDVLITRGSTDVIEAIEAEAAGAYA